MPPFHHVVLTAAHPAQARGYRLQIRWRRRAGLLPESTRFHVLPDPGGRRAGSLGATFQALLHLAEHLPGGRCDGQRILICHSGGDSRRTPAYAAQGKLFIPLPATVGGQPVALFDLVLRNLEELPCPERGHVLIASGDVLLTFDPTGIDFRRPGIVGVAYPGSIARGSRHGVYVCGAATAEGSRPVRDFLQKPAEAMARACRAVDRTGRVLVDTGLLSLDPSSVRRLLSAAGVFWRGGRSRLQPGLLRDLRRGACPPLDLYEELTMALAGRISLDRYLAALRQRHRTPIQRSRLTRFRRAVRRIPFSVRVLARCDFFHIGTSRELLANISSRTARRYGFTNRSWSTVASGACLKGSFLYNSWIETRYARVTSALVEACHIDRPVILGGRNILVGLPAGQYPPVRLAPDLSLVCLPIGRADWTAVLCGLDDDCKTPLDSANSACLFLNRPIGEWLARHGLVPDDLWSADVRRDLWEARLWVVGSQRTALDAVLWMAASPPGRLPRGWRRLRRVSLARLLPRVNHARLIEHREEIRRVVSLRTVADRLLTDDRLPALEIAGSVRRPVDAEAACLEVAAALRRRRDPLFRARALKLANLLSRDRALSTRICRRLGCRNRSALAQAPFDAVAEAVARSVDLPHAPRTAAILDDQVVWVTTPVRVDLAGGWSDTPPISTELGGAVVNAAITLNGQYPVQVVAKLNPDRVIRLSSIDLGTRMEIRTTAELLNHSDPHHWAALPKAALVLAGIGPSHPRDRLADWLRVLGGGIDLTIFSALPKGSGMGTSSILGAAVLACLRRVLGLPTPLDRLTTLTSVLEQRMNTGGGWQDQVGGTVPGVKRITTRPGAEQAIHLEQIPFEMSPGDELGRRLLLYYTGQKRMARDILHNVVGRYLARDPETLRTVQLLKDNATQMKESLERKEYEAFAREINRYWALKKTIDPASTNPKIERLLLSIRPWMSAAVLPGAGGGGFLLLLARDPEAAGRLRRHLLASPPNRLARFFDFSVDPQGLKVTVL